MALPFCASNAPNNYKLKGALHHVDFNYSPLRRLEKLLKQEYATNSQILMSNFNSVPLE